MLFCKLIDKLGGQLHGYCPSCLWVCLDALERRKNPIAFAISPCRDGILRRRPRVTRGAGFGHACRLVRGTLRMLRSSNTYNVSDTFPYKVLAHRISPRVLVPVCAIYNVYSPNNMHESFHRLLRDMAGLVTSYFCQLETTEHAGLMQALCRKGIEDALCHGPYSVRLLA